MSREAQGLHKDLSLSADRPLAVFLSESRHFLEKAACPQQGLSSAIVVRRLSERIRKMEIHEAVIIAIQSIFVAFTFLIFPLWVLGDCVRHPSESKGFKMGWVLATLVTWPIGANIYGFWLSKKKYYKKGAVFNAIVIVAVLAIAFTRNTPKPELKGTNTVGINVEKQTLEESNNRASREDLVGEMSSRAAELCLPVSLRWQNLRNLAKGVKIEKKMFRSAIELITSHEPKTASGVAASQPTTFVDYVKRWLTAVSILYIALVVALFFPLWMFVDCLSHPSESRGFKVGWAITMLLFPWVLGQHIYGLFCSKSKLAKKVVVFNAIVFATVLAIA